MGMTNRTAIFNAGEDNVTMTEVQRLPQPENLDRVESGPVQFGDDWPGVFIRGDNALFFALALRQAAQFIPQDQWGVRAQITGLMQTLQECSVGDTGWPPTRQAVIDAAVRDNWLARFEARKAELIAGGMLANEADAKAAHDVITELRES